MNTTAKSPHRNSGTTGRWALAYRVVVGILLGTTILAASGALIRPDAFRTAFPGATGAFFVFLVGVVVAGGVSLLGLLLWKRWAVWMFGIVGVAAVIVDALVSAPVRHQVAVVVSTGLVLGLTKKVRQKFAGTMAVQEGIASPKDGPQ